MLDHATPADRLLTSLSAKRSSAIAYLRARGKYLPDQSCTWRPTPSRATDIARTVAEYRAQQPIAQRLNFRKVA
jgi:hypothetical protein